MARVAAKLVLIFLLVYAGVFFYYSRLEKRWLAGTGEPLMSQPEKSTVNTIGGDTAVPEPVVATQNFQIIVKLLEMREHVIFILKQKISQENQLL